MSGFVEAARQEKLQELVKRGVAPFAYRFERSGNAADAVAGYRGDDDPTIHRLAGRLVALRPHGKTTFAHLADQSGKVQLYVKIDVIGPAEYELLSLLDLGTGEGVRVTDGRSRNVSPRWSRSGRRLAWSSNARIVESSEDDADGSSDAANSTFSEDDGIPTLVPIHFWGDDDDGGLHGEPRLIAAPRPGNSR